MITKFPLWGSNMFKAIMVLMEKISYYVHFSFHFDNVNCVPKYLAFLPYFSRLMS